LPEMWPADEMFAARAIDALGAASAVGAADALDLPAHLPHARMVVSSGSLPPSNGAAKAANAQGAGHCAQLCPKPDRRCAVIARESARWVTVGLTVMETGALLTNEAREAGGLGTRRLCRTGCAQAARGCAYRWCWASPVGGNTHQQPSS